MTSKTQQTRHDVTSAQHFDFDFDDSKGRRIGAVIIKGEATFTAVPDDADTWWDREAGDYLTFSPQATRDGSAFGAVQRDRYFTSEDDRQAAVAKYLKGARKRAERTGTPTQVEPEVTTDEPSERTGLDSTIDTLTADLQADVQAGLDTPEVDTVSGKTRAQLYADAGLPAAPAAKPTQAKPAAPAAWAPTERMLAGFDAHTVAAGFVLVPAEVRDDAALRRHAVCARVYYALDTDQAQTLRDLSVPTLQALWAQIFGRPTARSVQSNLIRWIRGAIANPEHIAQMAPRAARTARVAKPSRATLEAQLEALRAVVYHLTGPADIGGPGADLVDRLTAGGVVVSVSRVHMVAAAMLLPTGYTPAVTA